MTDLYDTAAALPGRLTGGRTPARYRQLRAGGATEGELRWARRTGRVSRPYHDCYLPGDGTPDLLDRVRAALAVLPPHAVVGFHTAAALLGFGVARARTVHIVVPAGTAVPQHRGIVAHELVLPLGDPVDVRGVPCQPPARCAVDLARTLGRLDALPVLDAALRCGAVSGDGLAREVVRHGGLRGVRQARELVGLADPRPECRQESQLRLRLHDAGVRGFVPQVSVRDEYGVEVCRPDLADEATRTGLEYDGASHYDRYRARSDRRRHNWLASRGWAMRYFTDHDLYQRPDHLVQTVRLAQASPRPRPAPLPAPLSTPIKDISA